MTIDPLIHKDCVNVYIVIICTLYLYVAFDEYSMLFLYKYASYIL